MSQSGMHGRWLAAGVITLLLGLVACDLEPTPTPVPLPTATPTSIRPILPAQPIQTQFSLPLPVNTSSPQQPSVPFFVPAPYTTPLPTFPPPPPPPTNTPMPTETLGAERPAWQRTTLDLHDLMGVTSAPGDPRTIYVGDTGHLYRSTDGGDTWAEVNTAYSGNTLVVAPSDPRILYAGEGEGCPGGSGSRLQRSTDGGASWTPVQGGADYLDINPTDPDHLIALWCDGIYRSSDGGQDWTRLPGSDVPPHDQAAFGRGVSNRGYIYAVYRDLNGAIRLQRTTDDARTWQTLPPTDFHYLQQLVVDPNDARWVYLLTREGFHVSTDAGATWRTANDGLAEGDSGGYIGSVNSLVVDRVSRPPPGVPSTLYVAISVFEGPRNIARWNGKNGWDYLTGGDYIYWLWMVNDPTRPFLLTPYGGSLARVFLR